MFVDRAGDAVRTPGPEARAAVAPSSIADASSDAPGATEPRRRRWLVWALPLFFWSLPAVLSTHIVMQESELDLWQAFLVEGAAWFLWALATPGMLALARRFPLDRPDLARTLAVHVAAGLAMGVMMGVASFGFAALAGVLGTVGREPKRIATAIGFWGCFGLFFYAATAAVGFAIDYHRKLREREVAASRLEGQLVEAKLSALRMQLQPHFLFNALNTVSMLVRQGDDTTAVRVVARLSDLLRYILDGVSEPLVPLRTEIDFVARYLEIEQLRFRDRLDVRIHVDDDVADMPVPGLVLQPLVENAIRHGIATRAAAGLIELEARAQDGGVVIRLRDDGPGCSAEETDTAAGIGIRNTRARLRYLYGDAASLRIAAAPSGGAEVTLTLPIRTRQRSG